MDLHHNLKMPQTREHRVNSAVMTKLRWSSYTGFPVNANYVQRIGIDMFCIPNQQCRIKHAVHLNLKWSLQTGFSQISEEVALTTYHTVEAVKVSKSNHCWLLCFRPMLPSIHNSGICVGRSPLPPYCSRLPMFCSKMYAQKNEKWRKCEAFVLFSVLCSWFLPPTPKDVSLLLLYRCDSCFLLVSSLISPPFLNNCAPLSVGHY